MQSAFSEEKTTIFYQPGTGIDVGEPCGGIFAVLI
jgi:hypothetical protein